MTSQTPGETLPQTEGAVEDTKEFDSDAVHHFKYHSESPTAVPTEAPSSGSSIDEKQYFPSFGSNIEEGIGSSEDRITQLARQLTGISERDTSVGVNPFLGHIENPALDPFSGKFRAREWVENLMGIVSRDPERYPSRTAGVSFKNLNVHGFGSPTDYQKTFGNYPLEIGNMFNSITGRKKTKIQILRNFDGLVKNGEMLVVLGRPGSGCSTLLKTISGETHGFHVDPGSEINYQGISMEKMHKDFRGECIYQAEVDVHFPQLTVGQTLAFAAEARAPHNRLPGVSRKQYAEHMRDVAMAVFGLTHTLNTKVGNDFIRGVSGGERKRVSIAEAAVGRSPLQCWDNSTRGLDSATALDFVKTLKISTSLSGATALVAIYQASQAIYDMFDKVIVLYEGRQIYFGSIHDATKFFVDMGFHCPERATTADFLTSLTSPSERSARQGFEARVPRTPDEFAARWQESEDRARLLRDIEAFEHEYPIGKDSMDKFIHSRQAEQANHQRSRSPYTISLPMQVRLCIGRGFQRLRGDMSITLSSIIGNSIMALVIGSVFYNLEDNTGSFYSRGALLFFSILLTAFSSSLEILTLYAQRPIVEKQAKYAFYHPLSEAIASMVCDLPNKILTSIIFDLTLYFMTNLRRTPGAFFTFYLFSFVCVLAMSGFFRMIGALSRSLAQAMAPAAVIILSLVIYTGFAIPTRDMHSWFRWINYLDPVAYAFEALMINEFHGRRVPCSTFVPSGPGYGGIDPLQHICSATGASTGLNYVDGDAYINTTFQYYHSHLWRNLGVLFAFVIFGTGCYLLAVEYISAQKSKGEVLLFRRGQVPALGSRADEEANVDDRPTSQVAVVENDLAALRRHETEVPSAIQKQTAVFHWDGVCYDIKIKGEPRRLLNEVDGWVKPGTLTALMGASGAGKTTLLDVLASRTTMGVISGEILVDGRLRNSGFQRKTGYVQQQDLHLATSTVREALIFSALLRQPKDIPRAEKIEYVDEVIKLLEMDSYANAVVGVPGEGLNVEQRKRLTIAVEMAAKPALLLFLDEPTSGLDSQTAWSILALLKKLAANGQAILCTIHQPSALLFQEFDRLLFLAHGGRTVYYGDIGEKSSTLTSYFERNGSRSCGVEENPAEWMLDVIGAAPGSENTIDWPEIWHHSPERQNIKAQLAEMKMELLSKPADEDSKSLQEFAAPFDLQFITVTIRVFQQYWRTPSYLYSKSLLCTASALFVGFSFWKAPTSLQGLQNQLFSIFMLMTISTSLVQQIMPNFVVQRALYEVRERPSKTYSWQVFMLSNIIVELPWNTLMAILIYICWYYPIGMYRNAIPDGQVHERGFLMFLLLWAFLVFTSTFTDMVVAGIEMAETAGNIATLLFSLTLIFCGVLAGPSTLPGFWIFMYRVSPFTYLIDGMLSTGLANTAIRCADIEYLHFQPRSGQTCAQYMSEYINSNGGYLQNPDETSNCSFCTASETNVYLSQLNSHYADRWRNFGILWGFILFNVCGAISFYWLARVPKKPKTEKVKKEEKKMESTSTVY